MASFARAAEIDLSAHVGGVVEAAVGDVLTVHLRGNASTGYTWERVHDDGSGVLVQARGTPPVPDAVKETRPVVGGPTTAFWRFSADKAGETELRLRYWRPWEKDAKTVREIAWTVRVH